MAKFGVDVSEHQGLIDWEKARHCIDFAILRAGFGKNNIDKQFKRNADACAKHGIPFGVYWFSYALSPEMAAAEADFVCDAIECYNVQYPVSYDFEYDTVKNMTLNGVTNTKQLMLQMANAFLNRVEQRGHYAMNYANIDFLNRGFSDILTKYDAWIANWGVSSPPIRAGIWQYTDCGRIDGISGDVDLNLCYKDYPAIIAQLRSAGEKTPVNTEEKTDRLERARKRWWEKYNTIADDVLSGKYGNGAARKTALIEHGYDYALVQDIVNCKLG